MTNDPQWIIDHRAAWAAKSALRWYYTHETFARLARHAPGGRLLEIGTGPGYLKAYFGDRLVSVDISAHSGVDVAGDVHALPFGDASFQGVVSVDVLHHFARPGMALAELTRVIVPGGRICLVEPWDGLAGALFYQLVHHETYAPVADPWAAAMPAEKDPMDGNTWIPRAILERDQASLAHHIPQLHVLCVEPFGGLAYVATGGFQAWGLPRGVSCILACIENALPRAVRRWISLRALYVLERCQAKSSPVVAGPSTDPYTYTSNSR